MAYDNIPTKHDLGPRDFGTGSSILCYLTGPKGKAGLLHDYGIEAVLEAFVATTLHPGMQVGTVADEDAYGDLIRFTSMAVADGSNSVRKTVRPDQAAFLSTYLVGRIIPADTVVMVTIEEGTGGSDTGQATPWVEIIWEK